MSSDAFIISVVGEDDLTDLLPLIRAYCTFYEVAPTDAALLALSRALIAEPDREGIQLLARDTREVGRPAVGFATVFWTWQTLQAARQGVMNDLFVAEAARGQRLADRLIAGCADAARRHGAASLCWQTARSNRAAQAVYTRVGAAPSMWIDYELALEPVSV
jgi:GNAT superfamily N-acetyltransferase